MRITALLVAFGVMAALSGQSHADEIDWAKVEDRTVGGGNLQDTHPQETRLANLGGPEPEDTSSLDAQGEVGPMDKRDEPRPRRRPRTDVAPPYPPPHADDAGGDVS